MAKSNFFYRSIFLLLLGFLSFFFVGCSNDKFSYEVLVTDFVNGEPIPNADIRLVISAGITPNEITDKDGRAVFQIPNEYLDDIVTLTVDASGYQRVEENVTLTADDVHRFPLKTGDLGDGNIPSSQTSAPPIEPITPSTGFVLPDGDDHLLVDGLTSEVSAQQQITVTHRDVPTGWLVRGVTVSDNGAVYFTQPVSIEEQNEKLVLDAFFGNLTYGISRQYNHLVLAVDPESAENSSLEKREGASYEPLPEKSNAIIYSKPLTVTRVAPKDRWDVSFWGDTELGSGESITNTTISELFFSRDWAGSPVSDLIPEDNWGARFVRRIYFPESQDYTFFVERDDGARLWIDGQGPIIDEWTEVAFERENVTVSLDAGFHDIEIAFYDDVKGAQLGFWIENPDMTNIAKSADETDWIIEYYPNLELGGDPVTVEINDNVSFEKSWTGNNKTPFGDIRFDQFFTDYFSTRATKRHKFMPGLNLFSVAGDDAVTVIFDGQTVFYAPGTWEKCHPAPCTFLVDVPEEGDYWLVVEQWQTEGSADAYLSWEPASTKWQSYTNPYEVRTMTVDNESIWAGGNGGLVRWDKRSDQHDIFLSEGSSSGDVLASNVVNALLYDQEGNLWIGTGDGYGYSGSGLTHFDGEKWTAITTDTTEGGLCYNGIYYLYQDDRENPLDNSVWVGTGGGLSRYDPDTDEWECLEFARGMSIGPITYDNQGRLWISIGGGSDLTNGDRVSVGVRQTDGETWETYDAVEMGPVALGTWGYSTILRDTTGLLWLGSYAGLTVYDGEWRVLESEGQPSLRIQAMTLDKSGNIWFGTPSGAVRYDGENWRTFTTDDGLASNDVTSFAVDEAGTIWAGHSSNGYTKSFSLSRYLVDDDTWLTFSSVEESGKSLIPNRVTSILGGSTGSPQDLWIGTGYPVDAEARGYDIRYYDGDWSMIALPEDIDVAHYVDFMYQDSLGRVWVGHNWKGGGVSFLFNDTWNVPGDQNGLQLEYVDDMVETQDGYYWFATSSQGLYRFNEESGEWRTYPMPEENLNAIFEDRDETLWVGTNEQGIAWLEKDGEWQFLNPEDESLKYITDFVQANDGIIWISTDGKGITLFNPEDETQEVIRSGDGSILSNSVYTLFKGSNGWIWAGTTSGVSVYTGQRWLNFTTADGLAGRQVWAVWENSPGEIWFGTNGGSSKLTFSPVSE